MKERLNEYINGNLKAIPRIRRRLSNYQTTKVDDYINEANLIKDMLKQSIETYKKGDNLGAKKLSEDAYFQHFENILFLLWYLMDLLLKLY